MILQRDALHGEINSGKNRKDKSMRFVFLRKKINSLVKEIYE